MKRLTAGISLLVPVAAGAVRWLDLVNFCDLTTGFVLLGPVWARYLCMAMVLSLGVLASFLAARRPSGLVRRSMSLGLLCLLAGGAFAALAGVQLAALLGGAEADVLETAQTVLYLLTALWLLLLGISRVAGSTVAPSGSAWTGILGTFAFYLLTVRRFCFNPSGIVRIVPTVQVFSALSALVLLQGAVKAFYLPHLPAGVFLLHLPGSAAGGVLVSGWPIYPGPAGGRAGPRRDRPDRSALCGAHCGGRAAGAARAAGSGGGRADPVRWVVPAAR